MYPVFAQHMVTITPRLRSSPVARLSQVALALHPHSQGRLLLLVQSLLSWGLWMGAPRSSTQVLPWAYTVPLLGLCSGASGLPKNHSITPQPCTPTSAATITMLARLETQRPP